jgi:hypothetical protein
VSHASLDRLRCGPLALAGGVAVVPGLPDAATRRAMAHEALGAARGTERQLSVNAYGDDGRWDTPARALANVPGGETQERFYTAAWLRQSLSAWCGASVVPTSGRGTYSLYTRPGDHLDLHVDVVTCDVTLITVVHDSTPTDHPGGGLAVYADHVGVPLSQIRASSPPATSVIKAPVGHSIVILGGLVPHRVLPLGPSGSRVISALCFQAVHGVTPR